MSSGIGGEPVLVMRGISKRFSGVTVLRDVNFSVRGGEVHALMGENGAGKSTLMKILGGLFPATAGTIELLGRPLSARSPTDVLRSGVALIHQEISLVPTLTVAENILLGAEPRRRLTRTIDRPRMRAEAARLLAPLDDRISPDALTSELSIAEQQVVEIARALRHENRVLVMDEPTAALSEREAERLFALIQRLRDQGVGIVYISHRMNEVERLADRVTVLRDGAYAGELVRGHFDRARIVSLMVGRAIPESLPAPDAASSPAVRLVVQGLSDALGRVRGVDLKVGAGEIVGLGGLMGAGRSEFARLIAGVDPRRGGRVWLDGQEVHFATPRDALASGVAYLPEDRKSQGLFLQMTAEENMTMTLASPQARGGVLRPALLGAYARNAVETFGIRLSGLDQAARLLSGGNQQKLLFARALALGPRVLLLDEPTRGVDVGAKQEIYRKIVETAATGVAIVVISSELPELLLLCSRIAVLHEGRLAGVLDRKKDAVTQEGLMALATGHPPDALS